MQRIPTLKCQLVLYVVWMQSVEDKNQIWFEKAYYGFLHIFESDIAKNMSKERVLTETFMPCRIICVTNFFGVLIVIFESCGFSSLFVSLSVLILALVSPLRFCFRNAVSCSYHENATCISLRIYLEMTIIPISSISRDKSHRTIQNRIVGRNAELARLMTVAIA